MKWQHSGHPNDLGSSAMYRTMVPSLYDVLSAGKTKTPVRAEGSQWVTFTSVSPRTLWYTPIEKPDSEEAIHAFTMQVRCWFCLLFKEYLLGHLQMSTNLYGHLWIWHLLLLFFRSCLCMFCFCFSSAFVLKTASLAH
jgi:hypothetical protein